MIGSAELLVEVWPIDRIRPYPRNARNIPDAAIAKVAKSLKRYGWRQPIVVDKKDEIVAGHTRHAGAKKAGFTQAPVHVARDLSAQEIRAYRLADNRTAQETSWNNSILSGELLDLRDLGDFDLELTGFDLKEINLILNPPAVVGKDEKNEEISIKVTVDQYAIIDSAIKKLAEKENAPSMSDGRALELLCADWLAGN